MNGKDDNGKPIMDYGEASFDSDKPVFYLGHSCDEWIIGDHEQAEAFIKQLQALMKKHPKED